MISDQAERYASVSHQLDEVVAELAARGVPLAVLAPTLELADRFMDRALSEPLVGGGGQ